MIQTNQMAWARRLKIRHLESFLVLDEAGTLTEAAVPHRKYPKLSLLAAQTNPGELMRAHVAFERKKD